MKYPMTYTRRAKDCAKLGLAFVVIYAIAYYMGWEKPYWATVSAASVSLLTSGLCIHRGIIRTLGAIVGGMTGLILIAMFPQERWAYFAGSCVVLGFYGWMMTGQKEPYFYCVAGITFCVVMAVTMTLSISESGQTFEIVALRVSQTFMGSLVMILITVYIWPFRSVDVFEDLVGKGLVNQQKQFQAYRDVMLGDAVLGDTGEMKVHAITGAKGFVPSLGEDLKKLRLEDSKIQLFCHIVLHGAEQDTFEMEEVRHHWHHFLHLFAEQMEAMERLREALTEVEGLDLKTYFPNVGDYCAELDRRFDQVRQMNDRKEPTLQPQPIVLEVDEAAIDSVTQIQAAALAVAKAQLEKLEFIAWQAFDAMAEIRFYDRPAVKHPDDHGHHAHGLGIIAIHFADRVRNTLGLVAGWVIAFLVWIYIWDMPGESIYWAMSGIFCILITYRAEYDIWSKYIAWGSGTAVAGVCYVFIMQHLDGYREFALMVFIATFLLYWLFYDHPHHASKMFAIISFTIVLTADNHQHYSLEHYIHYVLWLFLSLTSAFLGRAIFVPLRPQSAFLLYLDRFFKHAEYLIADTGDTDRKKRFSLVERWKAAAYRENLVELPQKMSHCAEQIDYRNYPGTSLEQVQDLVMSLHALAYRVKALTEAREAPRMALVEDQLLDEREEWHALIEEWFRRPAGAAHGLGVADDLSARLARIEEHVEEAFKNVAGEIRRTDYESFYGLLGSYRGLSEAIVGYSELAKDVDWQRIRETRF